MQELRRAHRAYGLALMVTETAVEGGAEEQCAWVDELVEGLRGLRNEGLPIVGVTWWPFIDFVDWSWASGGSVVEEFYRRDGRGAAAAPGRPARRAGWAGGAVPAPYGVVPPGARRRGQPRATTDQGAGPFPDTCRTARRRARSFRAAGLLANKERSCLEVWPLRRGSSATAR